MPPEQTRLSLAGEFGREAALDTPVDGRSRRTGEISGPAGEAAVDRRYIALKPAVAGEGFVMGYGHEYTIVDMDTRSSGAPEPSSNGHLHTLYMPMDFSVFLGRDWRLRLQPALSVSSNQLTDPGELDSNALQLHLAFSRQWRPSPDTDWRAGICADHRFGDFLVYPTATWHRVSGPWEMRLGFPDSDVSRAFGGAFTSGIRLFPAGNRWHVHDDPPPGDSFFTHKAWQAEWYVQGRFMQSWRAEFSLGKLFDNRFELSLKTGQKVRWSTDASLQLRFQLSRSL